MKIALQLLQAEEENQMKNAQKFGILSALLVAIALSYQIKSTQAAPQMRPLNAKATAKLVALGKKLSSEKGCNTCHGTNLQGKPKFAPSLRQTGIMKLYNPKTFARLMAVGLTEDGEKVKKPMPIYKMKASDSNALYAYLKTQK